MNTELQGIDTNAPVTSWRGIRMRMRENRLAMIAFRALQFMIVIALLADFLAYKKPITAVYKGVRYFPIIADYMSMMGLYQWDSELIHADWADLNLESAIWPPVRYHPYQLDTENNKLGPFSGQNYTDWRYRHYLGTYQEGRDVLSGLIHGTRISLSVGVVAMGIAALIGIILGSIAGYFGDNRVQISRIGLIFAVLGLPIGFFYGFQVRYYVLRDAIEAGAGSLLLHLMISLLIFFGTVVVFRFIAKPLERFAWMGKKQFLPIDLIISRILEIVSSIPLLLLLMAVLAITKQKSIYMTMVVIGLTSWAGIAQYMRAEMLGVRNKEFIMSAQSLGFRNFRILFWHALPNAISPLLIVIAFGVGSAILLEASLSFFGIGVPEDTVTWGKMLNYARFDIRSWWLTVFPGAAIFLTVTAMNLLGEGLRDTLDPKLRRP